jgi:outer membrane lipoprotein SlyB
MNQNDDPKFNADSNRPTMTGGLGPHPVGTSVGAAGGAVAGAVVGAAVGGPVGAAVGGAAGAATGALAGQGTAEAVNPVREDKRP